MLKPGLFKYYEFITEMDIMKGLEIPGEKYKTIHSCKAFTQAIGDVERKKIQNQFNASKFVAVIVDGSIGSAVVDNEIVFIQTCIAGEIHTDFLRCCRVECGDPEGIRGAIEKATTYLDTWERLCNKLVALGSDGASVMIGKEHCVIALLQKKKSSIIGIHCCVHRLELAYKDAICKNPLAEKSNITLAYTTSINVMHSIGQLLNMLIRQLG